MCAIDQVDYLFTMEVLKKIVDYINIFKPKDPDAPDSTNLRFMHGINRISIFMFLIALIIMIVKAFLRSS